MKLKINETGCLHIKRAGEWKKVYCPYAIQQERIGEVSRTESIVCGDECALFGEPVTGKFINEDGGTYLDLCHKSLYGSVIDERKKGE